MLQADRGGAAHGKAIGEDTMKVRTHKVRQGNNRSARTRASKKIILDISSKAKTNKITHKQVEQHSKR